MRKHFAKTMLMILVMLTVLFASAFSAAAEPNVHEVSTDVELSTELQKIADSADTEATIVLKADVNASTFGGIDGKKGGVYQRGWELLFYPDGKYPDG